jgi:hypothetical protein
MPFHHHLKHWFIPHKRNDHRPHLIRARGLAIMAALIIGIQATALVIQPAATRALVRGHVLAYASDITPVDLLTQTNQQRAAAGLPALRLDSRLNQSAAFKAADMFQYNYWAHVNPTTGAQPWQWFTQAGYPYQYAGENLAKDFDTTAGVMQGWMNSPGHKANILNANYTDVGFAVQNGTLVGGQTTLVVAHYGSTTSGGPTVAAVVAPSSTPKPAVKAATSTPAPTPTPTATPTPAPSPTTSPSASPRPLAAQATPGAPPPQNYSLFKPLSFARTLNWPTLATIALLGLLLVVYLITHLTVWRKGLRRWRGTHYRLYAAGQVSSLTVAIILLAVSGFGKVS